MKVSCKMDLDDVKIEAEIRKVLNKKLKEWLNEVLERGSVEEAIKNEVKRELYENYKF